MPYSKSYNVCISFFAFFSVSRNIPGYTVFVSHFPLFLVLPPKSWSYSLYFSYFTFSLFLFIFLVIQCLCLISTFFSFLATIQFLQCVFLIFKVFHCFLPYSMSYSVCFSFHEYFSVSRHISCPTM